MAHVAKALISLCDRVADLCLFFAYAKMWFSHDMPHLFFRKSHNPQRFSMGNSKSTKLETVTLTMPQKERDLHLAVMANDREGVRALISQGANINYPWSNPAVPSVKDSTTPLLAAVSLNHLEISMVSNFPKLRHAARNLFSVFPTSSDTNRAVQPQMMARGFKFQI